MTHIQQGALKSGSIAVQIENASGTVINPATGFALPPYNFISLSQTSTVDTYTFKSGGSGGVTVATITITFTDSTKATISTVLQS